MPDDRVIEMSGKDAPMRKIAGLHASQALREGTVCGE